MIRFARKDVYPSFSFLVIYSKREVNEASLGFRGGLMKAFNITIGIVVLALVFVSGCSKDKAQTVEALNKEALNLLQLNQKDKALETAMNALKKAESEFGVDHETTGACLETLGVVYQSMGQPLKAESAYKRALAVINKVKGPDSMESAKILNNLGSLFYSQNQYAAAATIYKKSMAIVEKNVSSDDPILDTIRKNIQICEEYQNGQAPEASTEKSVPVEMKDLVPEKIKESMISQLARQNIVITDLEPRMPVRMDNQGIVFPYHALKKAKDNVSTQEIIILFASVANPDNQGAFIFKQCRLISYQSYTSTMEKGGTELLKKELKEVFPDLYS